ncbi:cyclic nucleotide phosphodiesterase [Holotrichia oblita]|uniref:Cyclic nucleotide phosphodiesterase n=1 Tax=Holotrichia oblita TaxID=644536 RepID=A0ACB9T0L0_HOLOL|nr:cyclic nucleotide phosphodiesterase [Holotrichia oblita]
MTSVDSVKKKYGTPTRKADFKKLSLAFSATDKATRRVIAPYVNIVRRGRKALVKQEKDNKYFSFYLQKKPSLLMRSLTEFLDNTVDLPMLLHESAEALKCVTHAAGVRLYMVDIHTQEIYICPKQTSKINSRNRVSWKIEEGRSLAAYVACKMEYIMVDDILTDARFPDGIPYTDPTVKSVMCVPVVTPGNECYAVLELYRDVLQPAFQKDDLKIVVVVAGWMGASIYMNQQRVHMEREQQLNECLIELTKCYFADTIIFEKMIAEVVNFAKSTVCAERASFFVIDRAKDELVADLYDEGIEDGQGLIKRNMKIRFGKERGIAGAVARTGVHLNIKDAYNDPRFNKEVDAKTGFITRSILCMPIMGVDGVLGVVQAVNKLGAPCFTETDENIFRTFAVYCALALHYSYICQTNKKSEAKYEVALGLLKRHILPCIHDLEHLANNPGFYENPEAMKEFSWYISLDHMEQMPQIALHLILEITGPDAMNVTELMKFILSMRNFYRKNPYHNWEHGFNVCHCMYNILLRNTDILTEIEIKGLIIAALAHDVDHGGVTNNFLHISNDVMSQLYEESPWENHHYAVTMIMLSEINIYKDITADEFKTISMIIKDAILSTDLAFYFKVRAKLTPIVVEGSFDWELPAHRSMIKSIMMTVCDLSGQCKPFNVAKRITDILYTEFYRQGDVEKSMGLIPLSMMDRDKQNMIPDDQVQFLNVLVMPCCDLLRKCLPNTENLYQDAL